MGAGHEEFFSSVTRKDGLWGLLQFPACNISSGPPLNLSSTTTVKPPTSLVYCLFNSD